MRVFSSPEQPVSLMGDMLSYSTPWRPAASPGWKRFSSLLFLLHLVSSVWTIDLNIDDAGSVKSVAKILANDMTSYYQGHKPGNIPGNLPPPYYWWECGAMFGALIDYWYYTGDTTFNAMTTQGLLFQASPTKNFMPPNQTLSEGNDDQGFWAMAAMSAAERKYPDPPSTEPQWLALAQGVFNSQAARWDKSTCGGGLKWQIFALNNGYDYKNTISNGCFFNLAARLALYTKNHTYAEWATTTWDWTEAIGLISTKDWQVYDGADDMINCSKVNHEQWSYNAGIYLHGAAAMYNLTNGDHIWAERVQGLISGLRTFFMTETDIMHETTCERTNNCLVDQRSFKAYLARWIAATTQLVPWTYHQLMPKIRASAQAAAQACSGGDTHRACGLRWTTGAYDGSTGVGEEMAALEVIQSLLVPFVEGPSSISSGGTSKGDPNAGSDDATAPNVVKFNKITSSDQAGAGILTALVIFGIVMGTYWAMNP